MIKKYIKTGICIWCNKTEPNVSFRNIPHIIPHALGGTDIGVDICDECNYMFGTTKTAKVPPVDVVFKEVFNAIRIFSGELSQDTHKELKSIFFCYYHSKHIIRIKKDFNGKVLARQFKRGLFEVFLQKYHKETGDGNNPMFNYVREYAARNKGDLHVFYAFNNIILAPDYKDNPELIVNDYTIKVLMETGVFHFSLLGHTFYLEVFPILFNVKGYSYLQSEANNTLIGAIGNEAIYEFDDIMQIDFLMQRFNSKKI